jgi:hypothetical protein
MKLMRYNEINENANSNLVGGISMSEYDEIIQFVEKMKEKEKNETISDEDRILSEILLSITKEKDKLDFKSYYLRRLSTIKGNKYSNRKHGVETMEFRTLIWWLQDVYEWSFVEPEGSDRVRFDWNKGKDSFILNSDMTINGMIPEELKNEFVKKGIKLDKNQ